MHHKQSNRNLTIVSVQSFRIAPEQSSCSRDLRRAQLPCIVTSPRRRLWRGHCELIM